MPRKNDFLKKKKKRVKKSSVNLLFSIQKSGLRTRPFLQFPKTAAECKHAAWGV